MPNSGAILPKFIRGSKIATALTFHPEELKIIVTSIGVYILATFLESFLCPIGQNQVILLPPWLNECAAFRPGKYYFLIKRLKLTNVINPAGGKNFWMGYHFIVYRHPSGR